MNRVRDSLREADATVEKDLSKAFAGSSSRVVGALYQVFRASALNTTMNSVEAQITKASNQLLHLTTVLANALKIDSLNISETMKEEHRSIICTPAVYHEVHLDFETKDAEGAFVTPEGELKHRLLSITSSACVTTAAGALNPAYGTVGMARVGKTIALQGLAGDKGVRARFLYLSLGQGATVTSVLKELLKR